MIGYELKPSISPIGNRQCIAVVTLYPCTCSIYSDPLFILSIAPLHSMCKHIAINEMIRSICTVGIVTRASIHRCCLKMCFGISQSPLTPSDISFCQSVVDLITDVYDGHLMIYTQIVFLFSRNEWLRMESEQLHQAVESIQNNGVAIWGVSSESIVTVMSSRRSPPSSDTCVSYSCCVQILTP